MPSGWPPTLPWTRASSTRPSLKRPGTFCGAASAAAAAGHGLPAGPVLRAARCHRPPVGRLPRRRGQSIGWPTFSRGKGRGGVWRSCWTKPPGNSATRWPTVFLARQQPDQALADLAKAIAEVPRPTRYFHRAQAYYQSGKMKLAARSLQEAQRGGLDPRQLHPLERPAYQRLQVELK